MNSSSAQLTIEHGGQVAPRQAEIRVGGGPEVLLGSKRGASLRPRARAEEECADLVRPPNVPQAQLFGLVLHYIGRCGEEQRCLAEAHRLGRHYGAVARQAGATLHDTVQSLLAVRSTYAQLAMPLPGMAQQSDLIELSYLRVRINRFMDATLFGLLAGFEEQSGGRSR